MYDISFIILEFDRARSGTVSSGNVYNQTPREVVTRRTELQFSQNTAGGNPRGGTHEGLRSDMSRRPCRSHRDNMRFCGLVVAAGAADSTQYLMARRKDDGVRPRGPETVCRSRKTARVVVKGRPATRGDAICVCGGRYYNNILSRH